MGHGGRIFASIQPRRESEASLIEREFDLSSPFLSVDWSRKRAGELISPLMLRCSSSFCWLALLAAGFWTFAVRSEEGTLGRAG